jgi:hypothetical protein
MLPFSGASRHVFWYVTPFRMSNMLPSSVYKSRLRVGKCYGCRKREYDAMKAYGGSRDTAPHIVKLGNWGEWLASHPGLFNHRKRAPRCLLRTMLAGPQSQSGRCGEERNILHPPGIKPLYPHRNDRVVTIFNELQTLWFEKNIILSWYNVTEVHKIFK